METCRHCGASMSSDDALCSACGTSRGEDEPPERGSDALAEVPSADAEAVTSVEGDAVTSVEAEAEEAPSVPAGTWASTSESAPPPPPEPTTPNPYDREASTGRVRRVRDAEPEPSRPIRARPQRADAIARARARGLAVAPAPAEEGEPDETPRREAEVVAFPRSERAAASSSGMRINVPAAPAAPVAAPKFLASETLRERIPAEPYGWTGRTIAAVGGVLGTAAALVLGGHGPDLGHAAIFAAVAALAILPIPFSLRAGGFAVLASLGLVVATLARTGGSEGEAIGLATMGTTLLAAAQLLRATLRRSKFARMAMLLGIAVTGSWLALDGGLDAMVVREDVLEAWLGPAVRASLMILLALSLLAFVDESGRSGTHVWPWAILGWSLLEAIVAIFTHETDSVLAAAATPIVSAVAAIGWMQVWATTPGLGVKEPGKPRGSDAKPRGDG